MNITITCDHCQHHNPYDPCEITVVGGQQIQATCGRCETPIYRDNTTRTWLWAACAPDVLHCGTPRIDQPDLPPLTIADVVDFRQRLARR